MKNILFQPCLGQCFRNVLYKELDNGYPRQSGGV